MGKYGAAMTGLPAGAPLARRPFYRAWKQLRDSRGKKKTTERMKRMPPNDTMKK